MKAPQTQQVIPVEAKGPTKFQQPLSNREYLIRMIADCRKRIREAQKFKQKNLFNMELFCNRIKEENIIA